MARPTLFRVALPEVLLPLACSLGAYFLQWISVGASNCKFHTFACPSAHTSFLPLTLLFCFFVFFSVLALHYLLSKSRDVVVSQPVSQSGRQAINAKCVSVREVPFPAPPFPRKGAKKNKRERERERQMDVQCTLH